MKKIKTISLTSLRVEEDFGFQKLVLAETETLPNEETPSVQTAAVTAFETAFNAFDTALKASVTNPATATATDADTRGVPPMPTSRRCAVIRLPT